MKFPLLAALVLALGFSSVAALAADQVTASGDGLDLSTLAGEHVVRGRNPDGGEYEGKVRIRIKGSLVLIEWNTNDQVSYGTGLVEGMTLGVALESGMAIYQIVPQAEGKSLIGLWASEGADRANEESIYIGDTDVSTAKFAVENFNGTYQAQSGGVKGSSKVTISGGDIVKKIQLESGGQTAEAEGLALSDGLAIITPDGLVVFQGTAEKQGLTLRGHSVDESGQVREVALERTK